jgi:hypothetical protein
VEALFPLIERVSDFILGIPEYFLPSPGIRDFVGLEVPVPDAVPRSFDGELPAFVADC